MNKTVYPQPDEHCSMTSDGNLKIKIVESLPPLDPRIRAALSAIGLLMTSLGGALSACGRELNKIAAE